MNLTDESWSPGDGPKQYEVMGLPLGHEVRIARMPTRWHILRSRDSVPESWTHDYETANDALAALRRMFVE
jgi:hypothetical protein